MSAPFIRTVTKDISPGELGYCQCHEHLFLAEGKSSRLVPSLLLQDYDRTASELRVYREKGGCAVVDCQPVGCGRMASELLRASRETGVLVVASTGFHKLDFYEEGHFVHTLPMEELAELFSAEITQGMTVDNVNGENIPRIRGEARAGIIKTASDGRDIRLEEGTLPTYKKLFQAAAAVSKVTGVPIITHLEMGGGAGSILDVLTAGGVSPENIILCHIDRAVSKEKLPRDLEAARSGAFLELDTIGRFKYHSDEAEARYIWDLCDKGFESRILIGLDTTNQRMKSYGGSIGLDYILETFRETLRRHGMGDRLFHRFTVENPQNALQFAQNVKGV